MTPSMWLLLLLAVSCHQRVSALSFNEMKMFFNAVANNRTQDLFQFEVFSDRYFQVKEVRNVGGRIIVHHEYNIPIEPFIDEANVWCTDSLHPIGFAIDGNAIYNALTEEATDAVTYAEFDDCNLHKLGNGSHYHHFPVCVGSIDAVDEFIGVALDGNPIYGPKTNNKTELLKSADLDACHGRFVNEEYRYHITADFPYVIGCYKAEPLRPIYGRSRDGEGPPPGRRKRQTQSANCSNSDYGAELCDCTNGTLTQRDALTLEDASARTSVASYLLALVATVQFW